MGWFHGKQLKPVSPGGQREQSVEELTKQAAQEAKAAAITQSRLHMKIEANAANAALTKYHPLWKKFTGKETALPGDKQKGKGKKGKAKGKPQGKAKSKGKTKGKATKSKSKKTKKKGGTKGKGAKKKG